MPRVSEAHREARREQIRAAAQRAFVAKGYQRTSIADVVTESGLSAGAIYGHFADKRALFAAVAREVLGRRDAEIASAARESGPPPPSQIVELLAGGVMRDFADGRVLVQLWAESTVDPAIRQIVQDVAASLRAVLLDALRAWYATRPDLAPRGVDAAAAELLPVMMALGQGMIMQSALLDDFDRDAYVASIRSLLPA
jgi:TetR/AcrR family transcriptional regulator, transcriptional repressor of aconitase